MLDGQPAEFEEALAGLTGDARAARLRLIDRLQEAGVTPAEIQEAAVEGTLATILARRVMTGPPQYTARDLAELSGLDLEFVLALRRAGGIPIAVGDLDRKVFGEDDLVLMRDAMAFREAGLSEERMLEVVRVLGRGLGHAAEAMRQLVLELVLEPGADEDDLAQRYATAAEALQPMAGPMVERLLALHLRNYLSTETLLPDERAAGVLPGTRQVAVCFADLVGFTRLGEEIPGVELGRVADRLVVLAEQVVVPNVRFVKSIGDAVMFVSPDPDALLEAAFDLVDAADEEGSDFPQLRAGIAVGPAVNRSGDWFGRPVNLASRITTVARPGSVLAAKDVRDASSGAWKWSSVPPRRLKGVPGETRLYRARRVAGGESIS